MTGQLQPRHVAYTAVGTGLVASMAANVTHGLLEPDGGLGAVLSGLFWPLSLLLAIEVAVRLPWPGGWRWLLLRTAATTPVAAAAAIVSYLHMTGLLAHWHEHPLIRLIGPIAVDGLTTLGASSLLVLDRSETVAGEAVAVPAEPEPGAASEPAPGPAPTAAEAPKVPAPASVRRRPSTRKPPRTAPTDADLIDRISAAVAAGELTAEHVTAARVRALAGVGGTRAERLAQTWCDGHRRDRLTAVHH